MTENHSILDRLSNDIKSLQEQIKEKDHEIFLLKATDLKLHNKIESIKKQIEYLVNKKESIKIIDKNA